MRKIYLVPNFVTTLNMFCGFYSVIAATQGDYITAAWALVAAGICDMLDGRIARMAKATSEFGVQYDSLSDLVSFGLAPAFLLYQWALAPYGRLGWLAAFLFMACGALRLARFNVTTDKLPKNYFQGLPIPAAAGMVAAYVIFHNATGWPFEESMGFFSRRVFALFLALSLASLMVSTVAFPSFKEANWRSRASFGYLLIGLMSMILLAAKPELALFVIGCGYIFASLGWNVVRTYKKSQARQSVNQAHAHPVNKKA